MAQGQIKKPKVPANKPSQRKPTGARVIKPKKAALLKQQQTKKKLSAGRTALTEESLASKAGHLEILRGGKKDKKAAAKANLESKKKVS